MNAPAKPEVAGELRESGLTKDVGIESIFRLPLKLSFHRQVDELLGSAVAVHQANYGQYFLQATHQRLHRQAL